ncbi:MAG: hypothetical protein C5B54_04290 [Acidobacteria bacterium]|nr:MAG: hypothetical protein C5B54_04290 [Acidobacteriota bacterium]
MKRFKQVCAVWMVVVMGLAVSACGSHGSDLTGPSNSIPNVAGRYVGTMQVSLPEINQSVTCSASTSVTQSSNRVSIAPIQVSGAGSCASAGSLPIGDFQIDTTGSLGSGTQSVSYNGCTYSGTASGGFYGGSLRASLTYISNQCLNMNISFTLNRQ